MKNEPKRPLYYAFKPRMIWDTCDSIHDELAQAFFAFLYLTGARLNEATDFSLNRMSVKDGYVEVELRTLKTRDARKRWRKIVIPLPPMAKCHEGKMWKIVSDYLNGFGPFDRPFKKWKSKSGMSVYLRRHVSIQVEAKVKDAGAWNDKVIEKDCHPHFLRHCRATHLVEYYNMHPSVLVQFFGWTDQNMTLKYTSTAEILRSFKQKTA